MKKYNYKVTDEKVIEKIVNDDNVNINHMVLTEGEGLPQHYSNSNVYMIVIRGILTLKLDEGQENKFNKGDIINIPFNTKMDVNNLDKGITEFFVVKAPNPANYRR